MLDMIKKSILEDEREYCFDRTYCSDENWIAQNGNKTRERAYEKLKQWVKNANLEDIENEYGDHYLTENFIGYNKNN